MKNVPAKKYLGQHFLKEEDIAFRITNLLHKNTKHVLEIGPGMGALTKFLIKKNIKLETIEIDEDSVRYLNSLYPKLVVKNEDFLKIDIKTRYSKGISLIGNFPYNISSQILFKIYENKNYINEIVGMFQKEVAERIVCQNGKKRGILSVFIQAFYNTNYCFTVDPKYFIPPPKIQSGVVKFIRNKRRNLNCDENLFIKIVKKGFSQKRKTLRNSLKTFNFENKKEIEHLLNFRAEQLTVDNFIKITNHVS